MRTSARFCSSSIPDETRFNRPAALRADKTFPSLLVRAVLALLVIFAALTIDAKGQTQADTTLASAPIQDTHVLGFENVKRNVSGELSIDNERLRFQSKKNQTVDVGIASIQNVFVGEQDKQVGGVPMMLGKAAVPFGGGRVVSLFSHKKYDSVAIEYLDTRGGFHGVVLRLGKGQGETLKSALSARGALIARSEETAAQSTANESLEVAKWSVQVERPDPGSTTLDPCFSDAIYESLLRELKQSKQFNDVFRSGDRNANDVSGLLVIKMVIEKYSPGSETRRAVTTVAGATKLKVHIQLVKRNGDVVLERDVAGNVRFMGSNLRATDKLAKSTAKFLRSSLPAPAAQSHKKTDVAANGS